MKVKNYLFFLWLAAAILLSSPHLQAATISPNIFSDPPLGSDPNNCSLRYAIQSINNAPTFEGDCANHSTGLGVADTIMLQAGPYVLSIPGNSNDDNSTGDLDVIKDIKIIGVGSDQTSIDASGIDRVIHFLNVTNASITGVTIKGGDVSTIPGDGGGILAVTEFLNLEDVQIIGNKAGQGGGISVTCQPTVLDSVIQGNMAIATPGAGNAGGILISSNAFCSSPPLVASIENSQILGNNADNAAGGIFGVGTVSLRIDNSTIDGNTAINAGGLSAPVVGITNSTISRNQATGTAGGILGQSYLFLTNSTVSRNTAGGDGGGIAASGGLKGSYNVTVAFNEAGDQGGGVFNVPLAPPSDTRFPMRFFNTIIANNTATTSGPDCFGDFLTGDFNLIGNVGVPGDCDGFTGVDDQVGTPAMPIDPILLPLDFYGGSTETHALDPNSKAVDRGNVMGCTTLDQDQFITTFDPTAIPPPFSGNVQFFTLTDDQRFFVRPIAILDPNTPICDVGAFELQAFSFSLTKDDGLGGASIMVGDTFTYTMVLTNNGPGDATDVILNDPLPSQVDFISLTTSQGTCSSVNDVVSCDLGDMPHGSTATVTVTVLAVAEGDAVNTATVTTSVGDFVASVTTRIIGVVLTQGDNLFNCSLSHRGPSADNAIPALVLFAVLGALAYVGARRRRNTSH